MGTASLTREQLNEAINEFADKIMETLGVAITDEEATEPELSGTRFKAFNTGGIAEDVDAIYIAPGSVVARGSVEYFRCYEDGETGPWVRYSGDSYSHEEFAAEMRDAYSTPRIIHEG